MRCNCAIGRPAELTGLCPGHGGTTGGPLFPQERSPSIPPYGSNCPGPMVCRNGAMRIPDPWRESQLRVVPILRTSLCLVRLPWGVLMAQGTPCMCPLCHTITWVQLGMPWTRLVLPLPPQGPNRTPSVRHFRNAICTTQDSALLLCRTHNGWVPGGILSSQPWLTTPRPGPSVHHHRAGTADVGTSRGSLPISLPLIPLGPFHTLSVSAVLTCTHSVRRHHPPPFPQLSDPPPLSRPHPRSCSHTGPRLDRAPRSGPAQACRSASQWALGALPLLRSPTGPSLPSPLCTTSSVADLLIWLPRSLK